MNNSNHYFKVLSIAGSDSSGGAGIQADIKSISACGGYAATVLSASTAQNTVGVFDIHPLPINHIEQQLNAVLEDISFDAVKIGMLFSKEITQLVHQKLVDFKCKNIVVDPVMTATSGARLISKDSLTALENLFSIATLITPNIPETELLFDQPIQELELNNVAQSLGERYKTSVLLKGGHSLTENEQLSDVLYLYEEKKIITISHSKIDTENTHGTGCSLSSSIATYLAKGKSIEQATQLGCAYVHQAIQNGANKKFGKGKGPINHFGL